MFIIICRDGDNGFSEMACTFEQFDSQLLTCEKGIPYKYVVHTAKTGNTDSCYEYLHSYPHKDYNRCLMIPSATLQRIGINAGAREYHHYDTVVYPKSSAQESVVKTLIKSVLNFTVFSSKKDEKARTFEPLVGLDLVEATFFEFLQPIKYSLLVARQPTDFDFKKVVGTVEQIKSCLQTLKIHNHKQMVLHSQDKSKVNEVIVHNVY